MKEIIFTYIFGYVVVFVGALVYRLLGFYDLDFFIQVPCTYLLIIYYIFIIYYLVKHNYIVEKKVVYKNCVFYSLFSLSLAVFLNMIIFKFYNGNHQSILPFYLNFISSGIVGPIYEEILFRYLFFNRLKKRFSLKKSFIISCFVFAIIHFSFIKIMYAFILGVFFTFSYQREENILIPIFMHIFSNSIVLFLHEYHFFIFLLSFFNILIYGYIIFKQSKTSQP